MRDFLPKDAERMRIVEQIARQLARLYLYDEVITPIVESHDLLAAKAGEEIRHRMYAFEDLGGRKVALRPEFTPSIARLVATKMKTRAKPMRIFCTGSLYRYDEPQHGRYREFWQSNFELIGSSQPEADAEILTLTNDFMQRLGLQNYWLKVGHMGILRGVLTEEGVDEGQQSRIMQLLDKKEWEEALGVVQEAGISSRCVKTLREVFEIEGRDTFRVLDRVEKTVKDYDLAVTAVGNLRKIIELTRESGDKCELSIEAGFARGLEYYTGIIFEPYVPELDIALGGGGRYDKLVELFGGESTPAIGVAHGLDRLALAAKEQRVRAKITRRKRVLLVPIGDEPRTKAVELSSWLRKAGIPVEIEVMGRTVSRALQDADRRKVTQAIIMGPEELTEDKVVLRDMKSRKQRVVEIKNLRKEISKA